MLIAYFVIGAIFTFVRLWFLIRLKLVGGEGFRWKIFWLTEYFLENILLWPVELIVVPLILYRGYKHPEWFKELIDDYEDMIYEEDA